MPNDFHRVEFGTQSAARSAPRHVVSHSQTPAQQISDPPAPPPQTSAPVATDSVLVPLDQWNRLLGQLGNIHEAGQQLAEARERMARAETENVFLKERIRDLRAQAEQNQVERDSQTEESQAVPVEPPAPHAPATLPPPAARTVNIEFKVPVWLTRRRRRS